MPPSHFSLRYQVTAEDLLEQWEFSHFGVAANRRFTLLMQVTWALLFVAYFSLVWTNCFATAHSVWWIPFLFFIPGTIVLGLLRNFARPLERLKARHTIKQGAMNDHLGSTELTLSPDFLRYQNTNFDVFIYWSMIQDVSRHGTQIVFSVKDSAMIFLPRRVFGTETREQEFLRLVEQYRASVNVRKTSESEIVSSVPVLTVTPNKLVPWYQSDHPVDTMTPAIQHFGQRGKQGELVEQRTGMSDI